MARQKGPSAAALRYKEEQTRIAKARAEEQQQWNNDTSSSQSTSGSGEGTSRNTAFSPGYFQNKELHDPARIEKALGSVKKFTSKQVALGKALGQGGFATVFEVKHVKGRDSHATLLALKQVSLGSTTPDKQKRQQQGFLDLVNEVEILQTLRHPNITQLHGIMTATDESECPLILGSGTKMNGILLDRLVGTLETKLNNWQKQLSNYSGILAKMNDRSGGKKMSLYGERVEVAYKIASAISYMHAHKILFRDLKPENVGFDMHGDVKLFDFGLARAIDDSTPQGKQEGTYLLTGMSGSYRYMAPEVANGQPYNDTCDVYSMAILMWQVIFVKTPYENYTPQSLREKVYNGDHRRPPIPAKAVAKNSCNTRITTLLEVAWHRDIQQRPSMEQFAVRIAALAGIKVVVPQLATRKSTDNGNDLAKRDRRLTVTPLDHQEPLKENKDHEAASLLDETNFEAKRRRQGSFDYSEMDLASKPVPVRVGTKRLPASTTSEEKEEQPTGTTISRAASGVDVPPDDSSSTDTEPEWCGGEDYDPAMYFL